MKKLMFVAAAALAGSVFAEGEITSANVVGYQEVAAPQGMSMRTATFKAINGDYKISDIKVTGAVGVGGEFAQLVLPSGKWSQQKYYYLLEEMALVPDGWYKDMTGEVPVTDADVLKEGEAVFFTSEADVTFTFAGEVSKISPVIDVPTGMCMLGNPTPVDVKFSDIQVAGAVGVGGEFAQLVLPSGKWSQQKYYYLLEEMALVPDGWYKDMTGEVPVTDDDKLAPGEAVFMTSEADLTVTFPSAL